jgi:hypothetical protein
VVETDGNQDTYAKVCRDHHLHLEKLSRFVLGDDAFCDDCEPLSETNYPMQSRSIPSWKTILGGLCCTFRRFVGLGRRPSPSGVRARLTGWLSSPFSSEARSTATSASPLRTSHGATNPEAGSSPLSSSSLSDESALVTVDCGIGLLLPIAESGILKPPCRGSSWYLTEDTLGREEPEASMLEKGGKTGP